MNFGINSPKFSGRAITNYFSIVTVRSWLSHHENKRTCHMYAFKSVFWQNYIHLHSNFILQWLILNKSRYKITCMPFRCKYWLKQWSEASEKHAITFKVRKILLVVHGFNCNVVIQLLNQTYTFFCQEISLQSTACFIRQKSQLNNYLLYYC